MSDVVRAAEVWRPGPYVVPFIKGRVALYALLRAAGIGEGDEVLVPGYTCVVVPAAIQYTHARPVFYDIDPDTYNGDPECAEGMIGPRTRAVLVQHTYGMPAELGGLAELCRKRHILLIEDCAHAIGALTPLGPVGQIGDAAFTSFQWSKAITTGLGGAARANDRGLAHELHVLAREEFSEPSMAQSLSLLAVSSLYDRLFRPSAFWYLRDTYRWLGTRGIVPGSSSPAELYDPAMPVQYAKRFGAHRDRQITRLLARVPTEIAHRRTIATIYANWCVRHGVSSQTAGPGLVSSHLRFPLLMRNRDAVLWRAREQRIEMGDWFNSPLHPAEADAASFGYESGTCPVGEVYASHVVNLPTHRHVTTRVANRILAFLEENIEDVIRDPRREFNITSSERRHR